MSAADPAFKTFAQRHDSVLPNIAAHAHKLERRNF
jgi:hypothetical protein